MAARKTALKQEAQAGGEREFVYNGHVYVVPDPDDWSLDAIEAFEEGKVITCVKSILGKDQWAEYKRRENPKQRELKGFVEKMFEETAGVNPGE